MGAKSGSDGSGRGASGEWLVGRSATGNSASASGAEDSALVRGERRAAEDGEVGTGTARRSGPPTNGGIMGGDVSRARLPCPRPKRAAAVGGSAVPLGAGAANGGGTFRRRLELRAGVAEDPCSGGEELEDGMPTRRERMKARRCTPTGEGGPALAPFSTVVTAGVDVED
jgi:hypothetical protein